LIAWGCDRPKADTASAKAPAAAAPAAAPTTSPQVAFAPPPPLTSQPDDAQDNVIPTSTMMIDQRRYEFPQAMLRIHQSDGHAIALLYSDDPKDALSDNYRGNGFYFQLPLDVPGPNFDNAIWINQAQSSDRVETPYGIFLDGHRRQLQPLDVRIRLRRMDAGSMRVEITGTFLSVDPQDDAAATQVVPVAAWLLARER
jgi:hypothetical protein